MHNNGSSGYGSLGSNDHLLSVASSSESNGNGTRLRQEEEDSRRAKPVSYMMNSSSVGFFCKSNASGLSFFYYSCIDNFKETVVDLFVFICMFSQRTFQEICKGVHMQKNQEQQSKKSPTSMYQYPPPSVHHLSSKPVLLCVTQICV